MQEWAAAISKAAASDPHNACEYVPEVVPGRVLLVDGDMIAYSNAGRDGTPPGTARLRAIRRLEEMRVASGSERIVVHLTAEGSTKGDRYLIGTIKPYQGNRSGGKRPKNWAFLREWMESYKGPLFKVKVWYDREADDGIAHHASVLGVDLAAVASADKDFRMFPGTHVDWATYELVRIDDEFDVVGETGKEYGIRWFWWQMLRGDPIDHIPGLEFYNKPNGKQGKVGEVTATNLLEGIKDNRSAFDTVAYWYEDSYGPTWADKFAENAALLWMRRDRGGRADDWLSTIPETHVNYPRMVEAAQALMARIKKAYDEVPK